ncbi:sensor domain-containing diguanylate cyclase [Thiosulfativibrio zosterae]|uniref:diguanylate cyclase n=1 Tax=Thiosulfativibrio zosterae TaxID=2675053 RepID=A0A6F8PK29_9GAMM|nr:diguanylate cyclase [Thiosulfativibrio zosterae]BBP42428.1 hypothetical protein THMIRHAT_01740 [Thiosulfativibrio zosterae]
MFKQTLKYLFIYLSITGVLIAFSINSYQSRVLSHLDSEKELVLNTYQSVVDSFEYQSEILYINRINRPEVINLFKNAKDADLETQAKIRNSLYHNLLDMYQTMNHFQLKQLHFHLPNNQSFLRFHRPEVFGDDLTGVRKTVEYVNRTHEKIEGFEEGRIYNGYRFVYPLFDGKDYLGSVETSVSIAIILKEMQKNLAFDNDFIIKRSVVENKVFKSEQKNYQTAQFNNEYFHEASIKPRNRELINQLMDEYLKEHTLDGNDFVALQKIKSKFYIIKGISISNAVTHEPVAYILSAREHEDLATLYQKLSLTILAILLFVGFALLVYRHIDNQKRALEVEKTIHNRIETISSLGSWQLDINTNQMQWSDELYHLLDCSSSDIFPTLELLMEFIHPKDRLMVKEVYQRAIQRGHDFSIEHRIVRSNGIIRTVRHTLSIEKDRDGLVCHVLGMLLDITELKMFESELEKARLSYETLLKNVPEIIYRAECNIERTVEYINDAVQENLGFTPKQFKYNQDKSLNRLIHKSDRLAYLKALENTLNHGVKLDIEYRMHNDKGDIIWVHENTQRILDENDSCHLDGIIQNRTQEKLAQENLQKIIDLQDNIVILTNGATMSFANNSFYEFFQYNDLNHFLLKHQCVCEFFLPNPKFFSLEKVPEGELWSNIISKLPLSQRKVLIKNPKTLQIHAFNVHTNPFDDLRNIIVLTDITNSIKELDELRYQSQHDPLTGLYNRNFIDHHFSLLSQGATAKGRQLALILFDIDHFKNVNDNFGHNCGDEVLKTLSKQVGERLRGSDVLIRWGGEEFIILSEVSHPEQATQLAETLREIIANIKYNCVESVTSSFGVTLTQKLETLTPTVERADQALYQAKEQGRNRVVSLFAHPEET